MDGNTSVVFQVTSGVPPGGGQRSGRGALRCALWEVHKTVRLLVTVNLKVTTSPTPTYHDIAPFRPFYNQCAGCAPAQSRHSVRRQPGLPQRRRHTERRPAISVRPRD